MFDVKSNKAICVLPWIHEYKQANGKTAPCCHTHRGFRSNENIEQIRQQMLKGRQVDICSTCYKSEQKVGYSERIYETISWIKKFGAPDVHRPKLQYADIRFDPTCNLKCKTCGPGSSTLWAKEKGVKVFIDKNNQKSFNNINKKDLKKVYLAGGEPTYIKDYLEFLRELYKVNPDCEVVITTNLKKLPKAWKILMTKFNNLTIDCSCDAIESLGEYVRYPIDWKMFEENVQFVMDNVNHLQFGLVASNLTAHKIYETTKWMQKYSKKINVTIVNSPIYFTEKAVPMYKRKHYIDNLKKCLKLPMSVDMAVTYRKQIQHLIKNYTDDNYQASVHTQLKSEIIEQDSHRNLQLAEVDPFLADWIMA